MGGPGHRPTEFSWRLLQRLEAVYEINVWICGLTFRIASELQYVETFSSADELQCLCFLGLRQGLFILEPAMLVLTCPLPAGSGSLLSKFPNTCSNSSAINSFKVTNVMNIWRSEVSG